MSIFNFIILIFEILYYSLFMNFAKKENKIFHYITLFLISTIFNLVVGNNILISYLFIIFDVLIIGKYVLKLKTNLCDLYILLFMMLSKIMIEGITYACLFNAIGLNCTIVIFEVLKLLFVLILNKFNLLNKIYSKILNLWKNNNFYIRYFTIIFLIFYIIFVMFSINFL